MENFRATIKQELINHRKYETRNQAIKEISGYTDIFYSRQRILARIGYLSPVTFSTNYHKMKMTGQMLWCLIFTTKVTFPQAEKLAQFKTHLTVTGIISGIASTVLLASTITTPKEAFLYFTLCVTGGLLPDIDSGNSVPARLLFTFMATVISFLVIFRQYNDNTVMELFLIWTGSFVLIKYFLFFLFAKITVHRGIIHSIPAAVLFGFVSTIVLYRIFHFNESVSWMSGLSVFGGYIIHLLLDELYSLNINGKKPKKSAGTALKFGSVSNLKSTAFIYFIITILFIGTPEHKNFYTIIRNWFSGMGTAFNKPQGALKLLINSQTDGFTKRQKK